MIMRIEKFNNVYKLILGYIWEKMKVKLKGFRL